MPKVWQFQSQYWGNSSSLSLPEQRLAIHCYHHIDLINDFAIHCKHLNDLINDLRYTASTSSNSTQTCDTLQAPHRSQHRLAIHTLQAPQRSHQRLAIHCKHLIELNTDLRYTASTSTILSTTCDTLQAPQRSHQRLAIHCKHLNIIELNTDLRNTASTSSISTQTCNTLQAPHRSQQRLAIHCKHLIKLNTDLLYTASNNPRIFYRCSQS
jgi:hypothetical protein